MLCGLWQISIRGNPGGKVLRLSRWRSLALRGFNELLMLFLDGRNVRGGRLLQHGALRVAVLLPLFTELETA